MENAQLFSIASTSAMLGWLILLSSPWFPRFAEWVSGRIIPVLLSIGYTALVMVYWAGSEGDYQSLDGVMALMSTPHGVLIGWVHFLAFDLFIGAWEARTARAEGIAFWLVVPCFALTFWFGPIGLLLFVTIRVINNMKKSPESADAS